MPYEYDLKTIEAITSLPASARNKLMRYFARMSEPVRIEAHRLQTDYLRQHRAEFRSRGSFEELAYAMLLLALNAMYSAEHVTQQRNPSPGQVEKSSKIRVGKIKADRRKQKSNPVKAKVLQRYIKLIKRLREVEGMSWREIARYIREHHRDNISHVYLRQVYEEWSRAIKVRLEKE